MSCTSDRSTENPERNALNPVRVSVNSALISSIPNRHHVRLDKEKSVMRLRTLLAFLILTAFACGGSNDEAEEATPEATETAGESIETSDDASPQFDMTKPPVVTSTAIVPLESEIKNEGEVLIDVRTVDTVVDTAWVTESSGFPEVDEFALNHVLTNNMTMRMGWGDPPIQMKVSVRVPIYSDGQAGLLAKLDAEEVKPTPVPVTIPSGSSVENEGDVLVEVQLVEEMIDTAWVAGTSGYSDVDEIALDHVMKMKQYPTVFRGLESDSLYLRLLVRHQP